jgi:two-component system, OmpR family, alkaline phosphatase synthesis response regulator PhoP
MSTVLVIDDTVDCLEPLARLLRKDGHTVQCAANGREGLARLIRFQPDVIVLDMMMPVMDGVTFLEAMRCNAAWRDVRVVVFTGCGDALPAARLAELGVGEVFLKASTDFQRLLRVLS